MNQEHSNKLNRARILVMEELQGFAVRTDFWTVFEIAFGRSYDRVQGEELRSQWQLGEVLLPPLEVVSQQTLGTALGAYSISTGKIYLSEQFIVNATPKDLVRVILEEYGHHVDAQVNTLDSPGDEGAMFAALVGGDFLSLGVLDDLKTEDDTAWINLNSHSIMVERATLISSGRVNDNISGTAENDTINGGLGQDTINGGGG
ncbi:MAG: hypothetical protein IV298_16100, partial [Cylindrospermopsis raciborskii KL1]|nr:hypothetical protein [Cylindrospermopsis raciborskii KL1]